MKTSQELFERLRTDEKFASEFADVLGTKRKIGAKDYFEAVISAAEEHGYAVGREELEEYMKNRNTLINSHCIKIYMES